MLTCVSPAQTEKIRLEAEAKAAVEAEERRKKEQAEAEARRKQEEEERLKMEAAEAEERRKRKEAEAEERRKREEAEAEEKRKREEAEAEAEQTRTREEAEADERRKKEEAEAQKDDAQADGEANGNDKLAETSGTIDGIARSSEADGDKAEGTAPAGDETSDADQATPNSPNPSFSSLRGRPTPPATSPSPDGSMMPPSALPTGETMMRRGSSSIEAGAAPLAESAPKAGPSSQKSEGQQKEDARSLPPALLKGDDSLVGSETNNAADADSDGYGEPSPRLAAVQPGPNEPPSQQDQAYSSATGANAGSYAGVQSHSQKSAVQSTVNAIDKRFADQSMRDDMLPGPAAPRKYTFEVKVGDPQKVGDPMTAHTVFTVRTKTDSPQFRALQFSVLRRYSDFRWLHAALVHSNPGVIVPPVPEKVKLGRFAPELVEARRHGLETCINKILSHPILQDDDDLKLFLESDNFAHDVKMRDVRKGPVPTPEQKTYFGWSSNLGGPKFVETDEWFERQKGFLDSLESQLRLTVKAINALAQQRKEFAQQTSEFSSAMMVLSTSSLSRAISTCFAGLGEVQRRANEIAEVQSDADVREIGTVIYEHERVVGSVRVSLCRLFE